MRTRPDSAAARRRWKRYLPSARRRDRIGPIRPHQRELAQRVIQAPTDHHCRPRRTGNTTVATGNQVVRHAHAFSSSATSPYERPQRFVLLDRVQVGHADHLAITEWVSGLFAAPRHGRLPEALPPRPSVLKWITSEPAQLWRLGPTGAR